MTTNDADNVIPLPKRKPLRLEHYDYSTPGAYFVTICTQDRKCILSDIPVGEQLAAPETLLSPLGRIVDEQIRQLPIRFPSLSVDNYVIMPNHVHILLTLRRNAQGTGTAAITGGASSSPTVVAVVQALKSLTARLASDHFQVKPLWQRSFHDHIIRNEQDYREIWNYIDGNPGKWADDFLYPDKP